MIGRNAYKEEARLVCSQIMKVTGCIVQVEGTREIGAWHVEADGGLDSLGTRLASYLVDSDDRSLDRFVELNGLIRGRVDGDWKYVVDLSNGFVELDATSFTFREFLSYCSGDLKFVAISTAPSTDLETLSCRFNSFAMRESSIDAVAWISRRESLILRHSMSDWDQEFSLQKEEPVLKI